MIFLTKNTAFKNNYFSTEILTCKVELGSKKFTYYRLFNSKLNIFKLFQGDAAFYTLISSILF